MPLNDQNSTRQGYWHAEGFVELSLSRFRAAHEAGQRERQRACFYRLATFHSRTLRVLNSGLHRQDEALVQTALHNLLTLHRGMMYMHRTNPHAIPLPLALSEHSRADFVRDLIMRVLAETPPALAPDQIHVRANHADLLGQIKEEHVHEHLQELMQAQHVEAAQDGGFIRSHRPYVELDNDVAGLRALVGRTFYAQFAGVGYDSLGSIAEQLPSFKKNFQALTGLEEPYTAELFLNMMQLLLDTSVNETKVWRYQDLLHSPYPRPYQRAAFDAFRHGAYDSIVIDAPTGSGKTLIGMMCIQDWLRTLDLGQSILVLVPTSNYQQQWIDELCYNAIGLQLPPEIIFAGTPADLDKYQQLTGGHPALLLVTYTGLAQLASPTGKGGFDAQSVEIFLQQANVQHVILDEVHKVVEDLHSVSADLARLLVSWQKDTALHSLIGFSGTMEAFRQHCTALGLALTYSVGIEALVAAGFVAPFAELGVPFSYSARERRIRELLDAYKLQMHSYCARLGPARLRQLFAQIPLAERRQWGHEILGMYRGRADWKQAIDHCFQEWVDGAADELKVTEANLLLILQMAHGWSDRELAHAVGMDMAQFNEVTQAIAAVKTELATLVYLPATLTRLQADGFTTSLDTQGLQSLRQATMAATARSEAAKEILASTIVGLYNGLHDWYRRTGEGRVATIKAVIAAERAVRNISGVIVFDNGHHIPWQQEVSLPGYQGVGGLFSEMLGEQDDTVMAVLSNEMYLSHDPSDPVTLRIAEFISQSLMQGELAHAIFKLFVAGLEFPPAAETELRTLFFERVATFLPTLEHMHAARAGAFHQAVLRPVRKVVKRLKLGISGDRLLARMDRRNLHLIQLIRTLFDYGLLATHFREAHVATVEQVSGARQKFFVVTMPGQARRKQLMYDLTARIVDAESLPVSVVIVSNWARTGWNVIRPNLLIDATATRDVTAWQQLRGRAIRARRTWSNDCYRLLSILVGHHLLAEQDAQEREVHAQEVQDHAIDTHAIDNGPLDDALHQLLHEIATPEQATRLHAHGVGALDALERRELAVALMARYNKVTHIYELVKAAGSTSQVIYDRGAKQWQRRESIAAKHAKEISVNLFTGEKATGDVHAPLLYAQDPRLDVPAALQSHLQAAIAGRDATLVAGWLGE